MNNEVVKADCYVVQHYDMGELCTNEWRSSMPKSTRKVHDRTFCETLEVV